MCFLKDITEKEWLKLNPPPSHKFIDSYMRISYGYPAETVVETIRKPFKRNKEDTIRYNNIVRVRRARRTFVVYTKNNTLIKSLSTINPPVPRQIQRIQTYFECCRDLMSDSLAIELIGLMQTLVNKTKRR